MKSYILDSSQCTRVVLTDPGLGRSARSLWIREQLAVLYPGSIEDLVWDFRLNKRELVLYYMNRDQLAGIRGSRGKCRIRYGGDKREIFKNSGRIQKFFQILGTAAAAAILFTLLIVLPLVRRASLEERIRQLDSEVASRELLSAESLEREDLYKEISSKMALLEQSAPPDLYERVSWFTPYFNGEFKILSLTIGDDSLQGRAVGDDPLLLIEGMRSDSRFQNIEIENTDVDSLQGYEVFSWKGDFSD